MSENKSMSKYETTNSNGTCEKPDIKIFVSNRIDQKSSQIQNSIFVPVRCGAIYDNNDSELLGDDTGENISKLRLYLNEYTVMYWAWKNIKADYYGLCHYRRFLNLNNTSTKGHRKNHLKHIIVTNIEFWGLDNEEQLIKNISSYDMIINKAYSIYDVTPQTKCRNVKDNWITYFPQYIPKSGFEKLLELINTLQPAYYNTAVKYMNGKKFRGFNCFVMNATFFNEFCDFFFSIIFKYFDSLDFKNKSITQLREAAYIGEWLYDIWVEKKISDKTTNVLEADLINFIDSLQPIKPIAYPDAQNIVIASTEGRMLDVAITISSILKKTNVNRTYNFVVLIDNDNGNIEYQNSINNEKRKLASLFDGYENCKLQFYNPKNDIGIFEREEYYRWDYIHLQLPWILSDFRKVLWVDTSIVCKEAIDILYDKFDEESFLLYAPLDYYKQADLNGYNNCEKDFEERKYISQDLMLIDLDKFRSMIKHEKVISFYKDQMQQGHSVFDCVNVFFKEYLDIENEVYVLDSSWLSKLPLDNNYLLLKEFIPQSLNSTTISAYSIKNYYGQKDYFRSLDYINYLYLLRDSLFEIDFLKMTTQITLMCQPQQRHIFNYLRRFLPVGTVRYRIAKRIYSKIMLIRNLVR